MSDHWRLTEAQVSTAQKLHAELLPNWRFADRAFEFLKSRRFESEEVCLLTVVALDALYSTNLRYSPGRREDIARYIYRIRERLLEPAEVTPNLVEDIARQGSGNASISFASKFCHFFVSADFPIYDKFVCLALRKLISLRERRSLKIRFEPYPEFFKTCNLMANLKEPSERIIPMRQLDQCLWLMGQYFDFLKSRDHKAQPMDKDEQNEVTALIKRHPDQFQNLLPEHLRRVKRRSPRVSNNRSKH